MAETMFAEIAEQHDEVLAPQGPILLSDRDFLFFEALLTRQVQPNALVCSEVAEFNQGCFDAQGRYCWS
jgi:hypothetical protein